MTDKVTPGEEMYADLGRDGVDEATLVAAMQGALRQTDGGDIVVAVQDEHGVTEEVTLDLLRDAPNLRTAFGAWLGTRAAAMKKKSFNARVANFSYFPNFLEKTGRLWIRPRDIDDSLLNDYRDWLDDLETDPKRMRGRRSEDVKNDDAEGVVESRPRRNRRKKVSIHSAKSGKLKVGSKRRIMSAVLKALQQLQADPHWGFEIRRGIDLIRSNDWSGVANDLKPVEILNRPTLKMLVRICRAEVIETTRRLEAAWSIVDAESAPEDGAPRETAVLWELRELDRFFDGRPPKQQDVQSLKVPSGGRRFPLLASVDSASYRHLLATIYPSGRPLMPFLLLFAIYFRYNRSVVTALKRSDLTEQPSLQGGTRLLGKPFKNRAGRTQYASWPVNRDKDNPAVMIDTLERWTSRVRKHADVGQANHIFLERAAGATVRSLAETYAFDKAFASFVEDHEASLGRFVFRALRPSVINLVHHLFDGDLLATSQAGQHGVDVMVDHYLFDGARKANEEALVPALHLREAWRQTGGRADARSDRREGDLSAATPGFTCLDRYAGYIAPTDEALASVPGTDSPDGGMRLCTAYGMCPNCRLARIDVSSPENYALIRKLREAITRSAATMTAESWIGRWSAVADRIDLHTLRLFPPSVREQADLDIPDLPTVE
ncbi:hypothetical protein [Sphingomonas sp. CLY1604]|uniref:hypothetical protein n=1 Tax=Sphingomonas sp. CLY1604 TaxID=3457786 RepID=UPI003FD6ED2F